MTALGYWLYAFVYTQVIEMPIYRRGLGVKWPVAFGASALTHPIVWFVFPLLPLPWWPMIALAEAFAVAAEALYFWMLGSRGGFRALKWSLIANGASFGLGLLSTWVFGWPY